MGELASYRLSDFILFSQTTYYRQFELYNLAVWPLHIVAIFFSVVLLYALWKKPVWAGRVISGLLVVSWCWVAWAFLYINVFIKFMSWPTGMHWALFYRRDSLPGTVL